VTSNQPQLSQFAPTQFTFTRPKNNVSRLRRALAEWGKGIEPTHYLTFSFYDNYSMHRGQKMMDMWNYQMHQRLYRNHPSKVPDDKAIVTLGYPEYTLQGHLHYHCVTRVNPAREVWFLEIAAKRWKKIVPKGELHIQEMGQTEADLEDVTIYSTKANSFEEWYIPKDYHGMAFADRSLLIWFFH
jgi:hypothetical protein